MFYLLVEVAAAKWLSLVECESNVTYGNLIQMSTEECSVRVESFNVVDGERTVERMRCETFIALA